MFIENKLPSRLSAFGAQGVCGACRSTWCRCLKKHKKEKEYFLDKRLSSHLPVLLADQQFAAPTASSTIQQYTVPTVMNMMFNCC